MDIVEEIKKCKTDEELRELAKEAIEVFTEEAQQNNLCTNYLGDNIGIYPKLIVDDEEHYESNNVWYGYVPKGVRVTYGRFKDEGVNQFTNFGYYYYIDDDDYVYDFFKLIYEEDNIEDENDIIILVQEFIENLFENSMEPKSRQYMHALFRNSDNVCYKPIREHKFSDFYHNGSAMCSERALLAQNLLSLLGLNVVYINDFNHAYNIYIPSDKEYEETNKAFVLDFSTTIPCYDLTFECIARIPFYGSIKDFDKRAEDIFCGKERVKFPNYMLIKTRDKTYAKVIGKDRDYGVDYLPYEEKKIITSDSENKGGELILPGPKPSGKKLILLKDID